MSGHLLDGDSDSSHAASAPPLSPQPAAQQHSHSLPQDAELHRSPGNAAPHAPPPPGSPYTPPVRRTRPASPVGGGSPGLPLPCSRSPSPPRLITEERAATRTSRREALGLPVAGTSVAVSATAAEDSLLSLRPRSPQQSTASIRLDLGGRPGTSLMWTQPARETHATETHSSSVTAAHAALVADRTGVDAATLARRLSLAESALSAAHVKAQLAADEAARATALLHAERARNEGAEAAAAAAERGRSESVQQLGQLQALLAEAQHAVRAHQSRMKQLTSALAAAEIRASGAEQELAKVRQEASSAIAAASAARRSGDAAEAAAQRDLALLRAQVSSLEQAVSERDNELEMREQGHRAALRARDDALAETGAALKEAESALAAATQRGEQLSEQLQALQADYNKQVATSTDSAARTAAAHASEVTLLRQTADAALARAQSAEESSLSQAHERSSMAQTLESVTKALKTEQEAHAAAADELSAERIARRAAQAAASEHAIACQHLRREVKALRADRVALLAQHDAWLAATGTIGGSVATSPPRRHHSTPAPPSSYNGSIVASQVVAQLRTDVAAELAALKAFMQSPTLGHAAASRSTAAAWRRAGRPLDSDDDDDDVDDFDSDGASPAEGRQ